MALDPRFVGRGEKLCKSLVYKELSVLRSKIYKRRFFGFFWVFLEKLGYCAYRSVIDLRISIVDFRLELGLFCIFFVARLSSLVFRRSFF